ncbi:MAG: bifunctional 23S rRNA (guanine(2069)-N(7))-methyltransferase RlmK/23S rRNA (guanine(2445)-N(2))-methyltransferase RlmL [Myxococcales bacterium]|nr:bifunctional 23S rRNA (guanine(2069)-N(7))-methyltransferase RlmK/23S rRNA (guanine(2445)-N(2))-methyltransferase RlmL [Myxococcales bacterium]
MLDLFATAAPGLEDLVAAELAELGASAIQPTRAGVGFAGDLALAYRVCLWSRLASRVLLRLGEVEIADADGLYQAALAIPWEAHVRADGSILVDFVGGGAGIDNSHFGALRIKDAIVDRFSARTGRRPDVARIHPDLRVHAHLRGGRLGLAIDLAGESLHRRGYRSQGAGAPLKESLAAAILIRAGWPALAAEGAPLVDPMCGSGTLPIEAAWIAGDRAPGLARPHFGFLGWLGHDRARWEALVAEARERWAAGRARIPTIVGHDNDPATLRIAQANVERADLRGIVRVSAGDVRELAPPAGITRPGLVVCNPPYGERLGADEDLPALYRALGERLVAGFEGWQAAILTGDAELGMATRLRARRYYNLQNGAIPCRLLLIDVGPDALRQPRKPRPRSEGGEALANRVRKNQKALAPWVKRETITCYRIYDADIPEYAVAVDRYETEDDGVYAVLQEYAPPATIDPKVAAQRLEEAHEVVAEVLGLEPARVVVKVRRRQRRGQLYGKEADRGELHTIREGKARLLVNLHDYLDTGLYLDHRPVRALIAEAAAGRDVLNLFCYTASASVQAALAGARTTTSVDLSPRYLDWAAENFALNRLDRQRHRLVRADVRAFLGEDRRRYGLIYVDPPTFSNSKAARDFDVQREHPELLRALADRLVEGGEIIFSTHHRRFRLDEEGLRPLVIEDLSEATIPRDFARSPRIHRCYRLSWPKG